MFDLGILVGLSMCFEDGWLAYQGCCIIPCWFIRFFFISQGLTGVSDLRNTVQCLHQRGSYFGWNSSPWIPGFPIALPTGPFIGHRIDIEWPFDCNLMEIEYPFNEH